MNFFTRPHAWIHIFVNVYENAWIKRNTCMNFIPITYIDLFYLYCSLLDLTSDAGWEAAVEGCTYIQHIGELVMWIKRSNLSYATILLISLHLFVLMIPQYFSRCSFSLKFTSRCFYKFHKYLNMCM
jgi:hypothetical protein